MSMAMVYLSAMIVVWLIGHYGLNNQYRSRAITYMSLMTIFTILLIISAFRTGIGDTYFYKHIYELIGTNLANSSLGEVITSFDHERGFYTGIALLNMISTDPQLLVIVCAVITNALNLYDIYKFARPFELGIYLYFATVIFYVTMNGMRQALVASIFFWGVRYIIRGEWKKYLILILLLSNLHTSALLLIPVYYIARHEAWGDFFWKVFTGGVIVFIIFPIIKPVIVMILQDTQYAVYGNDMAQGGESVNLLRVLVMLVPPSLAFTVRKELAKQWKESHIFIFMSMLNFIFILWSIQYLYFYRVCMYFEVFNLALMPRVISCMDKQKGMCIYVYLIICYFIFAYYQVAVCWGEKFSNILFK